MIISASLTDLPVLLSRPELTSFLEGGRGRPGNVVVAAGGAEVLWRLEEEEVWLPDFHALKTSRSSAVRLPSDTGTLFHDIGVVPAKNSHIKRQVSTTQTPVHDIIMHINLPTTMQN